MQPIDFFSEESFIKVQVLFFEIDSISKSIASFYLILSEPSKASEIVERTSKVIKLACTEF